MTHKVCGNPDCAVQYGLILQAQRLDKERKAVRRDTKIRLERLKSITTITGEVQKIFNRCIVMRDKLAGHGCISCDTKDPEIQYCAGHWRSRGASSALRFNPDNVFLQCNSRCNDKLSGNCIEAEKRILVRIGAERLEVVKNHNEVKHWTREELYALKAEFLAWEKVLKAQWENK